MAEKRVQFIETMRGLACLLLVSWHVVGDSPRDGLNLPMDHPLHALGEFFIPLRMPLFAFISGYVFAALARHWSEAGGKLQTKARRLLLPLLTVGTIHFLLRSATFGHDFSNIWQVYVGSYQHFWYLQATFALMFALLAANALLRGRDLAAASLCMAAAVPLYLLEIELNPNWFSATKILYIAPFFFAGQLFRLGEVDQRLRASPVTRAWTLAALGLVVGALWTARTAGVHPLGLPFHLHSGAMLILSLSLCGFLFALRWENAWLASIGPYSFAIFLFHVIFTAAFRQFEIQIMHEQSPYVIWAMSLVVGVAAPIALQKALMRGPAALRTALLGMRYALVKQSVKNAADIRSIG